MKEEIANVVGRVVAASEEGSLNFGQIVGMLMAAGIEACHVDFRAARITYYSGSGETCTVTTPPPDAGIAEDFDAAAIQDAIRGSQRGEVNYPEFRRRSQAAGCASYAVWISGRHVTYYGRRGEMHVERFPQ